MSSCVGVPVNAWKILRSRYLLNRPWMRLREDAVERPDGAPMDVHIVEYPDWTCVVPLTDDGRLVLVEQYRHGIGRTCLEPPGGVRDPGEAPLDAARRELLEETGYAADAWELLGRAAPDPVRFTNEATAYVATGARRVAAPALDPTEDIAVRLVALTELPGLIAEGAIPHAMHLLALAWARERGYLPR